MRVQIHSRRVWISQHDVQKPTVKLSVEAIALEADVGLEVADVLLAGALLSWRVLGRRGATTGRDDSRYLATRGSQRQKGSNEQVQ